MALPTWDSDSGNAVVTTQRPQIGSSSDHLNTLGQEQNEENLTDKAPRGKSLRFSAAGDNEAGLPVAVEQGNVTTNTESPETEMMETAQMLDGAYEPTCTSTPVSGQKTYNSCGFCVSKDQVRFSESCKEGDESTDEEIDQNQLSEVERVVSASSRQDVTLDPKDISVPIRGYEIMEQRARFTVFKIQVFRMSHDSWYVFRRYTDFVQLNDKLVVMFPGFRLALPSKKWFGDNFDPNFLEDRQLGLQAFIDNISGHKEICNSKPCRDFFCFDDPPGPHDSLEESRSLCEALEEQLYNTKKTLEEREVELGSLREERDMYRSLVESLQTSLRIQRTLNKKPGEVLPSPQSSDGSLAECDQPQENKDRASISDVCQSGKRRPASGIGEGTVATPTAE